MKKITIINISDYKYQDGMYLINELKKDSFDIKLSSFQDIMKIRAIIYNFFREESINYKWFCQNGNDFVRIYCDEKCRFNQNDWQMICKTIEFDDMACLEELIHGGDYKDECKFINLIEGKE